MKKEPLCNDDIIKLRKYYIDNNIQPFYVYGYLCDITNKWYIGQTKKNTLQERAGSNGDRYIKSHGKYMKTKFANAIHKYGWKHFIPYVFAICDEIHVDEIEKQLIIEFNSITNGYNLMDGGQQSHNHSDETKEKLRLCILGENNPMWGKTTSDLQKEKARNTANTLLKSEEIRNKVKQHLPRGENHPMFGKHHTLEHNKKVSDKMKGVANIGGLNGMAKRIYCIEDDIAFDCVMDAARYYGLAGGTTISACCKGKRKTSKGKHFSYYIDEDKNE